MKKILKFILIIFLVLVAIFAAIRIHNAIILKKIYNAMTEMANAENLYVKKVYESKATEQIGSMEAYYANGFFGQNYYSKYEDNSESWLKSKIFDKGEVKKIYGEFDNYKNGKNLSIQYNEDINIVPSIKLAKLNCSSTLCLFLENLEAVQTGNEMYMDTSYMDLFANYLIMPAVIYPGEYNGEKCYIVNSIYDITYISKNTYLPIAVQAKKCSENTWQWKFGSYINGDEEQVERYEYSSEPFAKEVMEEPNLLEYDNVSISGSTKADGYHWPTRPISNTNLKIGESLVKNIKVEDNEEIEFYKMRYAGEDGIGEYSINSIYAYNDLREHYSNLPELAKEDFEEYTVYIVFKNGYKLSVDSTITSLTNHTTYLLNEEKTDEKSVLLVIRPNANENITTYAYCSFISKITDVKVDAQTSWNTVSKLGDEIKELLAPEVEELLYEEVGPGFVGNVNFKDVEILKSYNENIVNKDGLTTVWRYSYRIDKELDKYEVVQVYIDANTGEVICIEK